MEITDKQAMASSEAAAKAVAAAFKSQGYKLLGSPNTNAWGQSSLVIEMAGMRVLVEIGVQAMPKGTDLFIEFQSPLTKGPDDYDRWERIAPVLQSLVQQASKNFEGFGKLKVDTKGRGGEAGWPYVWIYPTPDKVQVAVDQFASRAGDFAEVVARKLKAAGVLESVTPMGAILGRLEEGADPKRFAAEVARIAKMTDQNQHMEARLAGCKLLGLAPKSTMVRRFELIDELTTLDQGMDGNLSKYAYNAYKELIAYAEGKLSPEQFDLFRGAF